MSAPTVIGNGCVATVYNSVYHALCHIPRMGRLHMHEVLPRSLADVHVHIVPHAADIPVPDD